LLPQLDELAAIRRFTTTLHKEMHVVWHEAVRKNGELLLGGSAQELRQDKLHCICISKQLCAAVRTKREGITIATEIVERSQTVRPIRVHERQGGKIDARRRPIPRSADLQVGPELT
jgi:hypothetical protein